jgi:hypothetical protein
LFPRRTTPESDWQSLLSEMKRVRSFGLAADFVVRTKASGGCFSLTALVASAELQTKPNLNADGTSALAVVVDADGVVRFADDVGDSEGAPTSCHGDDCAETTYVGIETLAGVSTRLSDQKIIEGG